MDSLERLQGLHADLLAFSETRLANIDRLWQELEGSVQDFRTLLDRPSPSAADREAYNNGKITVGDQQYGINEEFKHISRSIATTLDLDEIEAGRLLVQTQQESNAADQSLVMDIVGSFHNRRDLLLQCLRITLQQSLLVPHEDDIGQIFQTAVSRVLEIDAGVTSNGSLFARKCLSTLEEVEKLQAKVIDALQSRAVLGQPRGPEFYATLEFQRDSLYKQHEALACILAYLFQGDYTNQEDLRKLHNAVKRWTRIDFNLIHYLPAFSAGFRQYGSPGSSISQESTTSLDSLFGPLPQDPSSALMRPFQAVLSLWWTVEYSGQFRDLTEQGAGAEKRTNAVSAALKEDSLELMLTICTSTSSDVWRHPARQELVALLLSDSPGLALEGGDQASSYFRLQFMESLENFIEAFISNMPDSIRKLKTEEDDQRLNQLVAMQEGLPPDARAGSITKLHLECLLLLISFAFEQRPEAAEQWWEDPDSNLYGFLLWASRRQTVPRVSAFCELLCSISEDSEGASNAHKFLLDESLPAATRGRRHPSMNYQQIFSELELYARKVHERIATSQVPNMRKILPSDMNELESPVMLSCYLRLLAHLCRQSVDTRTYILQTATPAFTQALLLLCSGPVPTYLRASIFAALDALLTDKTSETATFLWHLLDDWASNGQEATRAAVSQTAQPPKPTLFDLQSTLNSIALSFDQYDSFIVLLRDLIIALPTTGLGSDLLPFPRDLGSSYRTPGIDPYLDFVCGQVFVQRIPEIADELQRSIGSFHCMELVAVGLEGFNEEYVVMMDRSASQRNDTQDAPVAAYARRSPFARLMQWILSTEMNRVLMRSLSVSSDSVETALPDSPLLLSLQRAIDIVNRVLDVQPTYFDVVRPLLLSQTPQEGPLSRSTGNSIEDSVATHPEVVLSLCQYAASSHPELALRALALLQKLSSSPKLNNHFLPSDPVQGRTRRIIDMLGPDPRLELEPVSKNLVSSLQVDIRELEGGFESVTYLIKDGILAFVNACLETQPDLPNIAHLLLGFLRLDERLTISDSIDAGTSVFNAVVDLAQNYPHNEDGVMSSWLLHIKAAALRILRQLWSSPLSQSIVIGQLRRLSFLQSQYVNQPIVDQQTLWDDNPIAHPTFWYTTSAEALAEFLAFRASLYNYTGAELRAASKDALSTVLRQALSTLQGKTTSIDGDIAINSDVFSFSDFLELDLSASFDLAPQFFVGLNLEIYLTEASDQTPSLYDVKLIREYLYAYRVDLIQKQSEVPGSSKFDEQDLIAEADAITATMEARNRSIIAHKARSDALHEYVELIIAIIECCAMDTPAKVRFILHLLEIMLPKLDVFISDESEDVIELARAADALLFSLSETAPTNTQMDNIMTEKLFQLFRASVEGIPASSSSSGLRTIFYSICTQYLTRITAASENPSDVNAKARRNCMDCIRSASQRLVQVMCDDAEDGVDECRLNALNLLALLTSPARTENSNFILNSFVKANMLEILIEPIKFVASDFQNEDPAHRPYLLSIFEARMLLLLQISRTRDGAGALLDAGLMSSIRDSLLFRADPDLGISLAAPDDDDADFETAVVNANRNSTDSALNTYYVLLSSTLRVLLSTFLSRGVQNEQVQYLARTFLTEHRANMVGVFKKYAGVSGKVDARLRPLIAECVRCYTGLVSLCDFVDFEDASGLESTNGGGFS